MRYDFQAELDGAVAGVEPFFEVILKLAPEDERFKIKTKKAAVRMILAHLKDALFCQYNLNQPFRTDDSEFHEG